MYQKILLLFFLLPFSCFASYYTECDSCNSYSDYELVATNLSAQIGVSNGIFLVYNKNEKRLVKIKILKVKSFEPGVPDIEYKGEIPLTSDELAVEYDLGESIDNMRTAAARSIAPKDIADSAYDLVGNSQVQNKVEKFFVDNQSINEAIGHYTATILSVATKVMNVTWVVEVNFVDGSVATFAITGIDSSLNIQLNFVEAVDSEGNNIPLTKSALEKTGQLSFTSKDNFSNFSGAAMRFDVPVVIVNRSGAGGAGGGGGGGRMSCTENETGGLSCTYSKR